METHPAPAEKIGSVFILSLGSNLSPRQENLAYAVRELAQKTRLEKISSVYETAPVGKLDQPHFYNLCLLGKTPLTPLALLELLLAIEKKGGRKRQVRWGPRSLDLDLLFHGQTVITTRALTLPHPRYHQRLFVLQPLLEIAPEIRDPRTGEKIREWFLKNKTEASFAGQTLHPLGKIIPLK